MSMEAKAVLDVNQGGQVSSYTVGDRPVTIGRSSDNAIIIDDGMVSRRHARVELRGNHLFITDLGSSNGTQVNGAVIPPQMEKGLNNRDVIGIGDSRITVRLEAPAPVKPAYPIRQPSAGVSEAAPVARVIQTKTPRKVFIGIAAAVVLIVAVVAVVVSLSIINKNGIRHAAANSLMVLTDSGIEAIDGRIIEIDQKLVDNADRTVKLEQVTASAYEWVEYQKTIKRTGSWRVQVEQEGLDQLKNDRYKISQLEILSDRGNVSSTVRVTNVNTGASYVPEAEKQSLAAEKEKLVQQRESAVQARQTAIAAINGALAEYAGWDVKKVRSTQFNVSGNGLGWQENLTNGVWIYYQDEDQIKPRNKQAQDLEALLTAKK